MKSAESPENNDQKEINVDEAIIFDEDDPLYKYLRRTDPEFDKVLSECEKCDEGKACDVIEVILQDTTDLEDIDINVKCILIDKNKVCRFKKKYNIIKNLSKHSTFYRLSDVLARIIKSVVISIAVRRVLPIDWIGNKDQSMMWSFSDRLVKYCTSDMKKSSGKKKMQSDRVTYTHSPHILINVHSNEGAIGESLLIVPCDTQDGKPSKYLINSLANVGLKIGLNEDVGPGGLRIVISHNGWEQEYNLEDDWKGVVKYQNQVFITDGWSLFKYSEMIDNLLDNKVFPIIQAEGLSGAIGPLDLMRQHLDKQDLNAIQIKHRLDPNTDKSQIETKYGNAKAAPIHIQCKFIADMLNNQKQDIQKYSTADSFHKSWMSLNPYKATENDKLCGSQLKNKLHGKNTEDMRSLNRLTFNPMKMSFFDLIEYVTKNQIHKKLQSGRKVTDIGKTTNNYNDLQFTLWENAIASENEMFNNGDNIANYNDDLRKLGEKLADKIEVGCKMTHLTQKQRDYAKYFHLVYGYVFGDWNFWTDFHEYSTKDLKPGDAGYYEKPPNDAHLEPYDSDNSDDMKEFRRVKRKCDKEQREAAENIYGNDDLNVNKHILLEEITNGRKRKNDHSSCQNNKKRKLNNEQKEESEILSDDDIEIMSNNDNSRGSKRKYSLMSIVDTDEDYDMDIMQLFIDRRYNMINDNILDKTIAVIDLSAHIEIELCQKLLIGIGLQNSEIKTDNDCFHLLNSSLTILGTPVEKIGVGLNNLGNTCYMNSTIQSLIHTKPFQNYLLTNDHRAKCRLQNGQFDICFMCNLHELFPKMVINLFDKPVSPRVMYTHIEILNPDQSSKRLVKNRQEDCHEFITLLFSFLQENVLNETQNANVLNQFSEMENIRHKYESIIEQGDLNIDDRTFNCMKHIQQKINQIEIDLMKSIKLTNCVQSNKIKFICNTVLHELLRVKINVNNIRAIWKSALDKIQYRINQKINSVRYAIEETTIINKIFGGKLLTSLQCLICQNKSNVVDTFEVTSLSVQPSTIELALKAFTDPELFTSSNSWFCESCKINTTSARQTTFFTLPPILILHLKRFEISPNGIIKKDNQYIHFTDELDMKPYLSNNVISSETKTLYNLYSIICHSSVNNSADSGHYYTRIKHGNEWFKFNDNICSKSINFKPSEESYILFFEKAT